MLGARREMWRLGGERFSYRRCRAAGGGHRVRGKRTQPKRSESRRAAAEEVPPRVLAKEFVPQWFEVVHLVSTQSRLRMALATTDRANAFAAFASVAVCRSADAS